MICTTLDTRNEILDNFVAKTVNKIRLSPIREYITAGSPTTPVHQLIDLAESIDAKVRRRVAENPNSPLGLLLVLLKDEDPDVRASIATNPVATYRLLECLIIDPSADVRFALAENHRLHLNLLLNLCLDDNPYVANRAQLTISRLQSAQLACAA